MPCSPRGDGEKDLVPEKVYADLSFSSFDYVQNKKKYDTLTENKVCNETNAVTRSSPCQDQEIKFPFLEKSFDKNTNYMMSFLCANQNVHHFRKPS